MMMDEIIIRASYTSGWPDCPRRGAAKIFRRIIAGMGYQLRQLPNNAGSAVGSSVHAAAKVILDEKAKTGQLAPASVATDAAVETLKEKVREGITYDRETASMADAEQQVVLMSYTYRTDIAPQVEPIVVETRLEATVPWTRNRFVLSGQADVIAREPGRVRDLKTGKRRGNHRPQLGSYGLLAKSQPEAINVTEAAEDYIARTTLKKQRDVRGETYRFDLAGCESAAVAVLRHMDMCLTTFMEGDEARGILPGDPWAFPANPSSNLCSERWCPAHSTPFCKEHNRGEKE